MIASILSSVAPKTGLNKHLMVAGFSLGHQEELIQIINEELVIVLDPMFATMKCVPKDLQKMLSTGLTLRGKEMDK